MHRTNHPRSIKDELVCPITLELPLDPVLAKDGRIYERSAITDHLNTAAANGYGIKSPYTNQPMGSELLPAPQIKNTIEVLIETGSVDFGDLSDGWKDRM